MIVYDVAFPFVLGGGQRRLWEVGTRLVRRGWSFDWLTFKSWEGGAEILHDGIRYRSLGTAPPLFGKSGKRSKVEPLIFLFKLLRHIGQVRGYDVVWVAQWPLIHVLPLAIACRLFGVPLVVDWWEVWPFSVWRRYSALVGWIGYSAQCIYLWCLGRLATIVTDTHLEEGRIAAITGRAGAVRVIPNGVPLEEIGPVDTDASCAYDVGCLVRLKDHKRVDLILDAIHALREKHGLRVTAAILGDGPERDNLEAQASRLGIAGQVTFFGFVPDAAKAYAMLKSARLCLVTTVGGGAGSLAILEGYGCGLPVISFRVADGIDPDLIDEGRTGMLVSRVDGEGLADAVFSILSVPGRVAEMKRLARAKAESMSWQNIAERYRNLFVQVTARTN